ncbi:bifunctional 3,4-dihydroxy-2-butanone-4-phosphate synthase/GTP cyclohydrolase II [Acidobacteriota bacterium]
MGFVDVETALDEIRAGEMIILVDDEDRENEGDLCCAAEKVTPQIINFMAKYGRGLICLPMVEARLDELEIPQMVTNNTAKFGTAFCVSIEARDGVTTGISAYDRCRTILTAINSNTKSDDLARPGHVFPLRAVAGGVLKRAGQTEGSVDLARMAALNPSAVICEVMDEDGTMMRVPQLLKFSEKHGLSILTIADLIKYRLKHDQLVKRMAVTKMPTEFGDFTLYAYRSEIEDAEHLALVMGKIKEGERVLVRAHSECLTGDVFHSNRCDCGTQLHKAMELIAKEGNGVILYMRQEGRGIGLVNKLKAYELQDQGQDTVEANETLGFKADQRDYGIGAQILRDLGLHEIRLLTNNPRKFRALKGYGLKFVERIPIEVPTTPHASKYMKTKKEKLGHLLTTI